MRIAFVINGFPAVSETFILRQIVYLIQQGHSVDIYAERPVPEPPVVHEDVRRLGLLQHTRYWPAVPRGRLERLKGAVSRLMIWGWRNPVVIVDALNGFRHGRHAWNLNRLNNLLPDQRVSGEYDVIHCHYGPNGERAVALRQLRAFKGPVITTFHGYDANLLPRVFGPHLYRRLFRHGDLFTVGSEFMRRRILRLGAPEDKIVKMPMGVDLARYQFNERKKKEQDEPFRLLTVARLVEVKGIEFSLRAAALVKAKLPSFRYQIAGDGPLRGSLERLAAELHLGDTVEFLGAVSADEAIGLYETAHAFLLPSIVTQTGEEENQPVVLAEAQATGLPVIASDIGGVSESMRDGESGRLVPARDPGAIAEAVMHIAEHPDDWGKMGRAGRAYVEEKFDLNKLNQQMTEMYGAVILSAANMRR
ncbi:glycosyltransferase [Prosthecobacter sp.]|uniref:glycosyltransferase n=1 Tax=Prosthecobacter sp. TaxID=1965333 RepID=UPI0037850DFF